MALERVKFFYFKGDLTERQENEVNQFLAEVESQGGTIMEHNLAITNTTVAGIGFYARTVVAIYFTLPGT